MKTVTATNMVTNNQTTYKVPTIDEALAHSAKTNGMQFDAFERKNISGGLPMVWEVVK